MKAPPCGALSFVARSEGFPRPSRVPALRAATWRTAVRDPAARGLLSTDSDEKPGALNGPRRRCSRPSHSARATVFRSPGIERSRAPRVENSTRCREPGVLERHRPGVDENPACESAVPGHPSERDGGSAENAGCIPGPWPRASGGCAAPIGCHADRSNRGFVILCLFAAPALKAAWFRQSGLRESACTAESGDEERTRAIRPPCMAQAPGTQDVFFGHGPALRATSPCASAVLPIRRTEGCRRRPLSPPATKKPPCGGSSVSGGERVRPTLWT